MMKKKIFKVVLLASLTVCTTIGITSANRDKESIMNIVFANIEALASSSEGGDNYKLCYSTSRVKKGYTYYDCGSCQKVYDEKGTGTVSKCFN